MPLLLLLPLLVLAIVALWAVLLPISLIQRYRFGRKRRRVLGWANSVNAWLVLVSLAAFFTSAWMATRWLPQALSMAAIGLAVGIVLGLLNLAISRREVEAGHFYVTPNALLVLALTLLVAGRILLGLWQLYEHGFQWHPIQREEAWFLRPDSLFALGGLLLGHYAAWCWGLRTMLRRSLPRRGE
ncbi:MAG: DUF1453 domain-containing protein [Xanthomonadaceae bacterium]|nr:DUF1453 domain-containing protein [Xanthomonadaceae bacterium]